MSDINPRGQKRPGEPLLSGRVLPSPLVGGASASWPPASPAALASAVIQHPRFSLHLAAAQLSIQTLLAAADRGTNLFRPLKNALAGIVGFSNNISRGRSGEADTLQRRIAAFTVVANAHAMDEVTSTDEVQSHLRVIAGLIGQLWRVAQPGTDQVPGGRNGEETKNLLGALSFLLKVFEFDASMSIDNRLVVVRQHLSSPSSSRSDGHHPSGIVSNNSNTTYNVGGVVINNNPVNNNFGPEHTAPDPAEKQEEAMKAIKSALGDRIVEDAWHDTQPKHDGCMRGTREKVLAKFMEWVKDDPMSIFWLAGMAGTGKTSIALTLCRMMDEDPDIVLGGAFFCSRSAGSIARTEARRILSNLSMSLSRQSLEFALALVDQLKEDDRVAHKPVGDQIGRLLVKPLAALTSPMRPIVFVIDALDECSNEHDLAELLRAISDFRSDARVKFILTSRPEMHIRGTPISNPEHNSILHLHTIAAEEVETDIRRYVLGTLQVAAPAARWYSDDKIGKLVKLANGLFIFASTALKYVLDSDNDEDREYRLVTATSLTTNRTALETNMDKMYELVLMDACRVERVDDDELERTQRLLACILTARTPLSVEAMADLMATTPLKLRGSLRRLHSLVYLPPNDVERGLRTLHASFGDYVTSRAVAHVRIAATLGEDLLARGCLHVMAKRLHFNVSESRSSYKTNPSTLPESITHSLEYACLQWIYHVVAVSDPSTFDEEISVAFRPRFLFWLEVMSILWEVSRASAMLILATSTFRSPEISQFLRDACAFVASSSEAIETSAPHIYLSALPFAPKDSLIYRSFIPLCTGLIAVDTVSIDRHGRRLVMTLPRHEHWGAVAYSPDGLLLSAGSKTTVLIWDTRTGNETVSLTLRLSNHDWVDSIVFSSDCEHLLISSREGGVFIWSFLQGQTALERLYDRTEIGGRVTFSSNGSLFASTPGDHTARLWNVTTRKPFMVLKEHTGQIHRIAFSSNCRILASISETGTILLWDTDTGEQVLVGRLDDGLDLSASDLALSPDGELLALTSSANIYLWELRSRTIVATLRDPRGKRIDSVRFSPDGRRLVSAGQQTDLCLWILSDDDAADVSMIVLGGPDDMDTNPAFSPNGLYIATTSSGYVKIWDADSGLQMVQAPLSYSDGVSFSVSSDESLLISGSDDESIFIWDALAGEKRCELLIQGDKEGVLCLAISPDGQVIASGLRKKRRNDGVPSADSTVRLWNTRTGEVIGEHQAGDKGHFKALAFSPDQRWIVSGLSKYVHIWNCATGQQSDISPLICDGEVQQVIFSPDGCLLAAVGRHPTCFHLWQAETAEPVHKLLQLQVAMKGVCSIAFSPTGAHIVSGNDNGESRVWDISTGQQVLLLSGHGGSVRSVAFSSNGQLIGTGGLNAAVCLWSAATGTLIATLHGHGDAVSSATFTPCGRFIVSASYDDTIRVWDVEAACSLPPANECNAVAALVSTRMYGHGGWLYGPRNELLLWVPEEYGGYVQTPLCRTFISKYRVVITADESGLCAGENWTACWRGNNLSNVFPA